MARASRKLWEINKPVLNEEQALRRIHKFSSPQALWDKCVEYFEWVEDNGFREPQLFHYQGEITRTHVMKRRAMTMGGLWIYLGISHSAWNQWEHSDNPALVSVCETVSAIIREQKFTGAAAGQFNPAIIARDLGLVDKQELAGHGGGPIHTRTTIDASELSTETLKELIQLRRKQEVD